MSFWKTIKEDFTEPKRQDPAYNGICDLFFCYPGVWALINYRFARFFYERNFIPTIIFSKYVDTLVNFFIYNCNGSSCNF